MRTVAQLLDLRGRVALVTGGAGHLGLAIGETLAELGADVVIVDRAQSDCDQRAALLRDRGAPRAIGIAADLGDARVIDELVSHVERELGRLDVLVNNAAYTGASGIAGYAVPINEQTVEAWDAALRVNLTAAFKLTQASRSLLDASPGASVINISSIYGLCGPDLGLYEGTPMGNPAAYGASKAGLLQLTRYFATVYAPRVRVNAVSPGGIERGQPATFAERYRARTPLGRMATEEDFKGVIALLASPASAYITGQNILVDGGWTAW